MVITRLNIPWILVASKTYNVNPNIIVHEVECPVCGHCETFSGDNAPGECYVCEERRIMPEV